MLSPGTAAVQRRKRWLWAVASIVVGAAVGWAALNAYLHRLPSLDVAWMAEPSTPGSWFCILNQGTPTQPDLVKAGYLKQFGGQASGLIVVDTEGSRIATVDLSQYYSLGPPVIVQDQVCFALEDLINGQQFILAYDAQGQPRWAFELSTVALAPKAKLADRFSRLAAHGQQLYFAPSSRDLLILSADGSLAHQVVADDDIFDRIEGVGPDGSVIAFSNDSLFRVALDGTIRWEVPHINRLRVFNVDDAGAVYYADNSSSLAKLSLDGLRVWKLTASDIHTFCGSNVGVAYCWTTPGDIAGNCGGCCFAVSPDGEFKWKVDLSPYTGGRPFYRRPVVTPSGEVWLAWTPDSQLQGWVDRLNLTRLASMLEPPSRFAVIDNTGKLRGVWLGPPGAVTSLSNPLANEVCAGIIWVKPTGGGQIAFGMNVFQLALPEP